MSKIDNKGTLIILSSVHWHFTWQRHHDIAQGFAKKGYRVIFIEPIPKRWPSFRELFRVWGRLFNSELGGGTCFQEIPENVTILSPKMLPDICKLAHWINRKVFIPAFIRKHTLRKDSSNQSYLINYLPIPSSLALQRALSPTVSAYDCVWDWHNDPKAPKMKLVEDELIENVTMVFADSPHLFRLMSHKHKSVYRVLPAVHFEMFTAAQTGSKGIREGEAPLLCYFGNMAANIDLELLKKVSHQFPLHLIGPKPEDMHGFSSRTVFFGPVPHNKLPVMLAEADVLLLPYSRRAHTPAVIPAKTFECMATGKPVVSIGLESLKEFSDLFYICDDEKAFFDCIERAINEPPALREARYAAAKQNDWSVRINQIEMYFLNAQSSMH